MEEEIILYDVQSVPDSFDIETLYRIKEITKFLFWDSSKNGFEPKQVSGSKLEFTLDISIPENKQLLDKLMKELNDKDADTAQPTE